MAEVGVIVTAKDKATAVLKKLGKSGSDSLKKLKASGDNAGKALSALPGQLGTVSTAMLLVQNSTSQMGGAAADAANKVAAVAGLIATGGPIGVGLAAMTLGLSAATAAWDSLTKSTRDAEKAQKEFNEEMVLARQETEGLRATNKDLSFEISTLNKGPREVAIIKTREEILRTRALVAAKENEIRQRKRLRLIRGLDQKQVEQEIENLETEAKQIRSGIFPLESRIESLNTLIEAEARDVEQKERQQNAAARAIQRRNDLLASAQQELLSWDQLTKAQVKFSGASLIVQGQLVGITQKLENKQKLNKSEADALRQIIDLSKTAAEEDKIASEKAAELLAGRIAAIDILSAKRQQARAAQLQLDLDLAKQQDAIMSEQSAKRLAASEELASGVAGQFGFVVGQIVDLEATATEKGKAIFGNLLSAGASAIQGLLAERLKAAIVEKAIVKAKATTEVTTAAAVGGANAAASSAALGPIAIGIGAAMLAAILGAFAAKFQFGGVVQGGRPGRDSVPALLTPGEIVMNPRESKEFQRGGGKAGGTVNINFAPNLGLLAAPTSDTDKKKLLLDLAKPLEELVRDGLIDLQGAGA